LDTLIEQNFKNHLMFNPLSIFFGKYIVFDGKLRQNRWNPRLWCTCTTYW